MPVCDLRSLQLVSFKKSSSQLYRHKEKSPIHQFSQKFLLIEKRKEIFTFSEEKTVSILSSEELLNLKDEGKVSLFLTFVKLLLSR